MGDKASVKEVSEMEKVGKLSPIKTYFTLLKGFIGTGVLFSPKAVEEGGWLFSFLGLFFSYILTIICTFKLLDSKKAATGTRSYKDIGKRAYGRAGKLIVEILIIMT